MNTKMNTKTPTKITASLASLLAAVLAGSPAFAQEVTTVQHLRLNLDSFRATDPARFAAADPDVSSLERRQSWARVAIVGGVVMGVGALAVGIAMTPKCPSGAYGESAEGTVSRVRRCQENQNAHFSRISVVSILAAVPGVILYGVIRPSGENVRQVAERHGLSRPQLSLNLGEDGVYGAGVRLAY
jgi:hypothetical protein